MAGSDKNETKIPEDEAPVLPDMPGEEAEKAEEVVEEVELNPDDSEEAADDVGVSGVYDAYGREVIPDVFENRLRQSKNAVKLAYGKLKNEILSHENIKRRYVGKEERYYLDGKPFVIFGIGDDCLVVAVNGERTECRKEKGGESFKRALRMVEGALSDVKKKEYYVPTAYAERYPYSPDSVIEGHEEEPPQERELGGEYDPIDGELSKDVIEELMGEDFDLEAKQGEERLEGLRQQATTVKGAVALTEPIVFFYGAARDRENNVVYVELFEVLNDKFLGKMLPQQFFAVAEGSERIEYLNLLSVEEAAKTANERPDIKVVAQCSARLLIKDGTLKRLKKAATTENKNLILSFDCALLEALGERGLTAVRELTADGVKIMMDNSENAGLKILTEYSADYLRFDGRFFAVEDDKKTVYLKTVVSYAEALGIKTCANYVDTVRLCKYLMSNGVDIIGGDLVGTPVRLVGNAIKESKKLPVVPKG